MSASPTPAAVKMATSIVNSVALRPAVDADSTLLSLGLDSLDRITIAMEIEDRIGGDVPEAELIEWRNVADVAATIDRITCGRRS